MRGLKDILLRYSTKILGSQLHTLLQGISALSLDKERSVRRDAFKALSLILNPISNDQLEPFFDILMSYLSCAMTHIDPNIKEDSLLFLDVLTENSSSLLARNSQKILPNFLDMISKLQTESKVDRQLVTTLSSKQTSIKWRIDVLSRLSSILMSMMNVKKSRKSFNNFNPNSRVISNTEGILHVPLYRTKYLAIGQLNFSKGQNLEIKVGKNSELEELKQFIRVLMTLMIESWLEVAPKQSRASQSDFVITSEASSLLDTVMKIMELLIEYVDMFESELGIRDIGIWFNENFRNTFEKNIVENFPYSSTRSFTRQRKRQEDFTAVNENTKCLEQNLAICHVFIWLTAKKFTNGSFHSVKDAPLRVLRYLNGSF